MLTFAKQILKPLYVFITNKNQRRFLWLLLMWAEKKRYVKYIVKVLQYKLTVPDCLSFVWQFKEIFVDEAYKFHSTESKPIIIDCGANIGLSCLYFKKLFPHAVIKAYEADPVICDVLTSNLKNNGINDVEIYNKAIWINNEFVEFAAEGADGGSVYFDSGKKIKIPAVRLKNILEKETKIDMLKIDIEGAETDVLEDCKNSLSHITNLFVEYHSWNNNQQQLHSILEILTKNGFRYFFETANPRRNPFVNKGTEKNMDLQLNIFAYKIIPSGIKYR